MANEQLLNYVKQARQSGKNDEQIKQELLSSGWQGGDIDEALKIKPPVGKSYKFPVLILAVLGIAVAGYFTSAYYFTFWPFEVSIAPVPTFTPRPNSAVKEEDLSTWKTYKNDEFGFEIKAPESYSIFQSGRHKIAEGEQVVIGIGVADVFGIFIDTATNLKDVLDREREIFGNMIATENDIELNGVSGKEFRLNNPAGYTKIVVFSHPSRPQTIISFQIAENAFTPEELPNQILSTFKFIEPTTYGLIYELQNISFYPSDQKLVKKVNNTEIVLVPSVRTAIPEFKDDPGYALKKLSFPLDSQKLYFIQIIDGSDAPPVGLWSFNLTTSQFIKLKTSSYYNWFGPKELSPNGKYVASTDDPEENDKYQRIYLINLEQDGVKIIVNLSGNETLNECALNCFGGVEGKLAWLDDKMLEFYVYDSSKTIPADPRGPVMHPLIEKRRVLISY